MVSVLLDCNLFMVYMGQFCQVCTSKDQTVTSGQTSRECTLFLTVHFVTQTDWACDVSHNSSRHLPNKDCFTSFGIYVCVFVYVKVQTSYICSDISQIHARLWVHSEITNAQSYNLNIRKQTLKLWLSTRVASGPTSAFWCEPWPKLK